MLKPKSLITIVLLAFIAISVLALFKDDLQSGFQESASASEDRVTVYYFHGNTRCDTCRAIEAYTKEAVEGAFASELKSGTLEFRVVNVDARDTNHFINDYQLVSSSVVLVRFDNNVQMDWKNLNDVWEKVHNKEPFLSYIHNEVKNMMAELS